MIKRVPYQLCGTATDEKIASVEANPVVPSPAECFRLVLVIDTAIIEVDHRETREVGQITEGHPRDIPSMVELENAEHAESVGPDGGAHPSSDHTIIEINI